MNILLVFALVIVFALTGWYALEKATGARPKVPDKVKITISVVLGVVLFCGALCQEYLGTFNPIAAAARAVVWRVSEEGLVLLGEEVKYQELAAPQYKEEGMYVLKGNVLYAEDIEAAVERRGHDREKLEIYVWPEDLKWLSVWEGETVVCDIVREVRMPFTYYVFRWYDRYPDVLPHGKEGMAPYNLRRS